jgi:DDE family transposase
VYFGVVQNAKIRREQTVIGITCLPSTVYDFLYQFKHHFRCGQGRHFLIFCWFLVLLIVDYGKGTIKGLSRIVPPHITYWAMMRMVRSGWWDADSVLENIVGDVLPILPPPADGTLFLIGDSTKKGKRGKMHPLGRKLKTSDYDSYTFGFEMVILIANWGKYRIPVALAPIDPEIAGHQNILFREMISRFVPPDWAQQVIVEADAGFAANKTFKLIEEKGYFYVCAVARTRKFTDGKHLSDLARHLPRSHYRRLASYKPDGRRRDYWTYSRTVELNGLGEVTMVLSKKRRNDGPKKIKIIVTNLKAVTTGEILSMYARRWGVEVTIHELKAGLHLGQMQVTKAADRVKRSVMLPVMAYLLLVKLYHREEEFKEGWSLFKLKQRFIADVFKEQLHRSEDRWTEKLNKLKAAA